MTSCPPHNLINLNRSRVRSWTNLADAPAVSVPSSSSSHRTVVPVQSKWNGHKEERTLNGSMQGRKEGTGGSPPPPCLAFQHRHRGDVTRIPVAAAATPQPMQWRQPRARTGASAGATALRAPRRRWCARGGGGDAGGKRDSVRRPAGEKEDSPPQSKAESGAGKTCVQSSRDSWREKEGRKESAPHRTRKDLSPPPPPSRPLLQRRLLQARKAASKTSQWQRTDRLCLRGRKMAERE